MVSSAGRWWDRSPGVDECGDAIDDLGAGVEEDERLGGGHAQAVGPGDGSKRIDVAATAITAGMSVDDLANLDLAYAPPYSPAIDSILSGSNVIQNKMNGVSHSLSPLEVARLMSTHTDMVVLDVRTRGEFDAGHIDDPRVQWMSLVDLNKSAQQLPREKLVVVVCHVGQASGHVDVVGCVLCRDIRVHARRRRRHIHVRRAGEVGDLRDVPVGEQHRVPPFQE